MSATAQPNPDLHIDCAPVQIGDQIMVRLQIADNFGLTFQFVMAPDFANGLGQYILGKSLEAKKMLIKPPSMLTEN
jgi:hypothetical protein